MISTNSSPLMLLPWPIEYLDLQQAFCKNTEHDCPRLLSRSSTYSQLTDPISPSIPWMKFYKLHKQYPADWLCTRPELRQHCVTYRRTLLHQLTLRRQRSAPVTSINSLRQQDHELCCNELRLMMNLIDSALSYWLCYLIGSTMPLLSLSVLCWCCVSVL